MLEICLFGDCNKAWSTLHQTKAHFFQTPVAAREATHKTFFGSFVSLWERDNCIGLFGNQILHAVEILILFPWEISVKIICLLWLNDSFTMFFTLSALVCDYELSTQFFSHRPKFTLYWEEFVLKSFKSILPWYIIY